MAQPSSTFTQKFNAVTPAGVEKTFAPSGMRTVFEDLWKQGKIDTSDLWDQGRFWEKRDPLMGKAQKPGLENGEAQAPAEAAAKQADTTPLQNAIDNMNPERRAYLENGLDSMLQQPMEQGPFSFEALALNPEAYTQEYITKVSPETRTLFEQRMQAVETIATPVAAQAVNSKAADDTHDLEPSHDGFAFMACAIGSGEAGRVHEYLRTRGNDSTLAANNAMEEEKEEAKFRQMQKQMMLNTITGQISAIDRELAFIDRRIGEIDQHIEKIDLRVQEIDHDIEQNEIQATALREERAERVAENVKLKAEEQKIDEKLQQADTKAGSVSDVTQSAKAALDEAMNGALRAKDGNAYALNKDGKYVYVEGDKKGQTVAEDQRLSWWDEVKIVGSRPSAEFIERRRQIYKDAKEHQQDVNSERDTLLDRKREIRTQINGNNSRIEEIDSELTELAIDTENLTQEKIQLLLEKEKLVTEKSELSERKIQLLEERADLMQQKDLLMKDSQTNRSEYLNAADYAIINDQYINTMEQTRDKWKEVRGMIDSDAEVDQDQIAATKLEIERLNEERTQLEKLLQDLQNGNTDYDQSQLSYSVREQMAVAHVTDKMDFLDDVELSEIDPESLDAVASAMLAHENSDFYIASLQLNINDFSDPVQKQIIEASIKQDIEMGRETSLNTSFLSPDMIEFAEQKMAELAQKAGMSVPAMTSSGLTAQPLGASLSSIHANAVTPAQTPPAHSPSTEPPVRDYTVSTNAIGGP
ncbi:MAG: hypothetical protein H6867_05850 [Rhodospirillales bacterium]|nr:hypothetical protein [Rhodospirillales bacterium]MCB9995051.1 hypothetical protein [Rhodospirillales bacterium]